MKNLIVSCFFLLVTSLAVSQEKPYYTHYTWSSNPKYKVDASTTEELLELDSRVVTEFIYDEEGNLVEYLLEHRILWLNSDPAIESFNKIYLPYSASSELLVSKARVITSQGKVLELDDSDIKTARDEETGQQYKYFAFEGVEKGSFIEYYYVERKDPDYNGKRIFLQSGIAKEKVSFDLYSPSNLVFEFKSLNGTPEVQQDTLTPNKLHWKIRIKELEKLEEEEFSAYNASRAAVVYKLDRNLYNNTRDISSYGGISQNLFAYYYPEYPKRTLNRLQDFLKESVGSSKGEERLRKLEYFIKNNVYTSEGNSEELGDLEEVLKKKVASEVGLVKLYTAALTAMDVEHEMVLTTDRQNLKFDRQFEAANYLTDFLIYFPEYNSYLSPTDIDSRYGFPPAFLTDTYGLFIKKVTLGNLTSGLGRIDFIEPVPADKTFDKMFIQVDFNQEDPANIKVHLDRGLNGYYGMYIHPFMHLIKEQNKKELIEGFATRLDEGAEIVKKEILNGDPELFGLEPLRFVLDFNSDAFMEKAGPKYLFKVGELIGRQVELYQEKERVLPLEEEFQRSYFRTIQVNLPEGYKVANLEDLNINNSFSRDGKELLSFRSSFQLNGNVLTITADEHYRINQLTTEEFEEYRTVINSAADFNKISLVLEPVEKI